MRPNGADPSRPGRLAPVAWLALILLAACDVGSVLVNQGSPDGGGSNGCVNAATPGASHLHVAGGTPNLGQACIAIGCHLEGNLGTGASAFGFAGTLYTEAAAQTVVKGATIQVKAGATPLTAVSDADGNFVYRGAVTFPATTLATQCPSLKPMIGGLSTGGGNCNNCHRPAGTTSPIFLQ